jgi:hypothetical protein
LVINHYQSAKRHRRAGPYIKGLQTISSKTRIRFYPISSDK